MVDDQTLRIYLEEPLLLSARAGAHNFINLIAEVAKNASIRVDFVSSTAPSLAKLPDYSLTHMAAPQPGGLVFRRTYYYPFWQIDQTEKRWAWDVAKAKFDPDRIEAKEAKRFTTNWQKRLFGELPQKAKQSGYIYVPLQGRLAKHRSFQACSPIEMIEQTLAHAGTRKVIATLHPKEDYTAQDIAVLETLNNSHAQLEIGLGEMEFHLQNCDYVVTQNSSAAFAGYFFGKPALLFAGIDFHHIAIKADTDNLAESFLSVASSKPDYAKYIWWFLQEQSINAGRDDAKAKIAARFRKFGWPM